MANRETTGVGGCGGGCTDSPQMLVPKRCVLERLSPTPAQAAKIMHDDGTYGDWVEDVPVQGPTDRGIRAAGCWWKDNVLDKVTDLQGAIVPRWTQSSLCIGNRLVESGIGGVGETVRRGGALGQPPPGTAPITAPGLWSKLADAESRWVATTLIHLNDLIVKAGNRPCATWPAEGSGPSLQVARVGCFQSWFNLNAKGSLRTDGVLDEATLCALVTATGQHAADFPTPYPGTLHCDGWLAKLTALSLPAKIGIGAGVAVAVAGTAAAVAASRGKKRKPSTAGSPG